MKDSRTKILFAIVYAGDEHTIQTFSGEYRDLKSLIEDKLYPDDFGQCGGMGRCATCMVEINGPNGYSGTFRRNEMTTLSRLSCHGANIRLSCQVEIDSDLANCVVNVLDTI